VDAAPLDMPLAPACVEAVRAAGRALEELGHAVEPVSFDLDLALLAPLTAVIDGSYTQAVEDWDRCEPHNRIGRQRGLTTTSIQYVESVGAMQRFTRELASRWGRDYDVLLTPTLTIEPPPAGRILEQVHANPEVPAPEVMAMVAFTVAFNVSGLPAISLPVHQSPSGLPVGVQLVERPFNDAGLLRVAAQLESALPWAGRHPAIPG
jgi:amidase